MCTSPSWFITQDHVLSMRTFLKQGQLYKEKSWYWRIIINLVWIFNFVHSTVAIMTLFETTSYHWVVLWMICFIPFLKSRFPYWIWQQVSPYTKFWITVHRGCDVAYSSPELDLSFALSEVRVALHSTVCIFFTLTYVVITSSELFLAHLSWKFWSPFARRLSVRPDVWRLLDFYIFNFFSRTAGPILTKVGTNHP
jgi:hypothetical protein